MREDSASEGSEPEENTPEDSTSEGSELEENTPEDSTSEGSEPEESRMEENTPAEEWTCPNENGRILEAYNVEIMCDRFDCRYRQWWLCLSRRAVQN